MKKVLCIVLSLLMVFALFTSCGGGSDTPKEKVATYAIAGNWNTLQPGHFAETGYYGPIVWGFLYDSLVVVKDGGFDARGAKSWSASPDNTVYTFKLDDKATFTDGTPVTAKDWVFSAKLLADKDFSVDYTKLTVLFTGTDEVGLMNDEANFGVKALDDYTLQVTMKDAMNIEAFLNTFNCYWYVLPSKDFEGKTAKEIAASDYFKAPKNTSGPWIAAEHTPNATLSLTPNKNYHLGTPKLDRLEVQFMSSTNFASAMMSGSVDYVYPAVDAKQGSALQADSNINVTVSEYPTSSFFLMINTQTVDEKARLAMDMAVNKAAIVEALWGTGAKVVESIELKGTPLYNESLQNRYNPEAAKAMLAQSSWNMDETLIFYCAAGLREKFAAMVQADLQAIGMKVDVQTVSIGTLYAGSQQGKCHMITGQGVPDEKNPWYFAYNAYISGTKAGTSCTHNLDPKYEEFEAAYNATTDAAEQLKIVQEYQQYMYDHALVVPVAEAYDYSAVAKRLVGIDPTLTTHESDNTWEWDIVE